MLPGCPHRKHPTALSKLMAPRQVVRELATGTCLQSSYGNEMGRPCRKEHRMQARPHWANRGSYEASASADSMDSRGSNGAAACRTSVCIVGLGKDTLTLPTVNEYSDSLPISIG